MSILTTMLPLEAHARMTGRSWWRLRYVDGRTVDEREVDWSLAPPRARMALQLVCPNGKVAQLGNTADASGRLFQLKVGIRSMSSGKSTLAHVIGIITGTDGQCRCAAWEPSPGRIVQFDDNVFAMQYQQIGALSADVLGITS